MGFNMGVKHKYDEDWNSLFYYDESSPSCLRWKCDRYRGRYKTQKFISSGDVVGSLNVLDGYWHVHVLGKMYNARSIVWTMFYGNQGVAHIDHIDRDRGNTKIINLRLATTGENARNHSKSIANRSGISGVFYRKIRSRHGDGKFNDYWFASWRSNKQMSKAFSVAKLGYNEAFTLACEYRAKMIEELNAQGAGYSETHGQ